MNKDLDQEYMLLAIKEAKKALEKDEVPIGAIIVKDNEIISKAHNLKEKTNDPTAHAEMEAIKKASKRLKNWRLNNCTMYVTLEPCFMCMAAIMESRIERLVFALKDKKRGAAGSVINLKDINKYHKIKIESGICEKDSNNLLNEFFEKIRLRGKRK